MTDAVETEHCAYCPETEDLARDFLESVTAKYRRDPPTILLCRFHVTRRGSVL